jgi:hypothetical protein
VGHKANWHSNFDTLIRYPILHYHTSNVDLKPHVADYITGWKFLSHNCVFETSSLDDDELNNFTCVSCLDGGVSPILCCATSKRLLCRVMLCSAMNSYFLYFGLFIHVPSRIAQ